MLVLCLSFSIVLLDQCSKYAVRSVFMLGQARTVIPGFFDLQFVQNTGAAWGLLAGLNHWLILFSFVMLGVIVIFRRHFITKDLSSRLSLGLIIGGIAGNLLDRVRLSYVVDFLDFYVGRHHFPAFNVADASICVGVGLYVIFHVFHEPDVPESQVQGNG